MEFSVLERLQFTVNTSAREKNWTDVQALHQGAINDRLPVPGRRVPSDIHLCYSDNELAGTCTVKSSQ